MVHRAAAHHTTLRPTKPQGHTPKGLHPAADEPASAPNPPLHRCQVEPQPIESVNPKARRGKTTLAVEIANPKS
jgi:hypothetical protein